MAENQDHSESKGNEEKGFIDKLWSFFRSTKLAIFLLIFISATAIIGTLVPQNPTQGQLAGYSEGLRHLFQTLNLFDMYHSRWFYGSLALLCVNLLICSLDRIPAVLNQIKLEKATPTAGDPERMKTGEGFNVKGNIEEITGKVRDFLKKQGGRIIEEAKGDNRFFLFNRGRYSRLGVYVLHLSIILVVLGALAGNIFGFRGRLAVREGESTDSYLRQGSTEGDTPLGFTVACKSFSFSSDAQTGMIGDYKSDLEIKDVGRTVITWALRVNHPIYYKGVGLFQSSYQLEGVKSVTVAVSKKGGAKLGQVEVPAEGAAVEIPGGGKMRLIDAIPDRDGQGIGGAKMELNGGDAGTTTITIIKGQPHSISSGETEQHRLFDAFPNFDKMNAKGDRYFQIGKVDSKIEIIIRSLKDESELGRVLVGEGEEADAPGGLKLKVAEYTPDFDVHGKSSKSVMLEISKAGQPKPTAGSGMEYSFVGSKGLYSTILDVNYDPGVWLVWAGCIIMFLGLWMAFFWSHRKVWIKVSPGRVSVGGNTNRNQQGFESQFRKLAASLKEAVTQ